jgi:hypothetical protein
LFVREGIGVLPPDRLEQVHRCAIVEGYLRGIRPDVRHVQRNSSDD